MQGLLAIAKDHRVIAFKLLKAPSSSTQQLIIVIDFNLKHPALAAPPNSELHRLSTYRVLRQENMNHFQEYYSTIGNA